tara:strand:+ start:2081 stop:3172 length:1092 start_codon:yes stop_codon:yes gene_type:complete
MAASPNVMQQIAATGQSSFAPQMVSTASPIPGGLPPQSATSVAPPPPPAPTPQSIGGQQSLTPGQIIFTEYQARVFNQTEAMYKTSGFLGISLFEDSYLLSKATANYIVSNIGLSGPVASINPSATQTYRGVLGIANPAPPPPPPPDPNTGTGFSAGTGAGNGTTVAVATTPTKGSTVVTPPPTTPVTTVSPNLPTSVSNVVNAGEFAGSGNAGTTSVITGTGTLPSTPSFGGSKIICNELYRQGFLTEQMWDADERYGEMMFEKDPKLVIGYQMWARSVVKYMRKNPNNTKMAAWLFKPWTEYMGYKMGVVEKPTLRGRFTNWIGTQFSYAVFNAYNGKRLLDKYNYKVFKAENNIPTYNLA